MTAATPAIPFLAPPLLALCASSIRGLTGFGDGISFQAFWSLAAAAGALPSLSDARVLRRAVFFSTLMQSVSMPMQLWQARAQLRLIAGYAAVMSACGAVGVVAGARMLLEGEPASLRYAAGFLFYAFAVGSLGARAREALCARHAPVPAARGAAAVAAGGGAAIVPPKEAADVESAGLLARGGGDGDDADVERAGLLARGGGGGGGGDDVERAGLLALGGGGGGAAANEERAGLLAPGGGGGGAPQTERAVASPPDSAAAQWVPAAVFASAQAASAAATSAAGVSATGTGASAGEISAGESAAGAVNATARGGLCGALCAPLPGWLFPRLSPHYGPRAMLIMLCAAGAAGGFLGGLLGAGGPPLMLAYAQLALSKDVLRGMAIEPSLMMALRLAMYVLAPGSVVARPDGGSAGDAPLAAALAAAALAGMTAGSAARHRVPADAIIVAILCIVYVAAALMLHADADARVAALFAATAALGAGGTAVCWASRRAARAAGCV